MISRPTRLPIPIRYYYEIGQPLASICERCGHEDRLDLASILEMHGRKVTLVDLRYQLLCVKCKADRPDIRLSGRRGEAFR